MKKTADSLLQMLSIPLGQLAQFMGSNRTVGQVYAALLLQTDALCLEDLQEQLGLSKGGICTAVQRLVSLGLARKIWMKGERKDYYLASGAVMDGFIQLMESELWPGLTRNWMDISLCLQEVQKTPLPQEVKQRVSALNKAVQRISEEMTALPKKLSA